MAKKTVRRKTSDHEEVVAPVSSPEPVEPPEWRMPQPGRGDCVVVYPRGTVSERNAGIAFVVSVGEKSIDCVYMNNAYGDCIHRSDPRIKDGAPILEEIGGIWEFKKDDLSQRIEELEKRIEQLEG